MNLLLRMDSPGESPGAHPVSRADPVSRPESGQGSGVLSPEDFRRLTDVSRETLARLECYAALLRKWNRAINLVGAGSLRDPWRRHFLDSAQLLPLLPPVPGGRDRILMDLGSGAGFPGLVLAILGAGRVHLCEADRKKAVFLREVARETGTRVRIHDRRIEDLAPFPVDAFTARACAPLARVLSYAAPFLAGGGSEVSGGGQNRSETPGVALVLMGRTLDRELTDSAKQWNMRVERIASRSDPRSIILRFTRRSQEDSNP